MDIKKILILPLILCLLFLPACASITAIVPYVSTGAKIVWDLYQTNPEFQELVNNWFSWGGAGSDGVVNTPHNYRTCEEWYASLNAEERGSLEVLAKMAEAHKNAK